MNSKKIVIIDDHPLLREGLKSIIQQDARFEVVGEAGDGTTGLEMIDRLVPDLVILDITLPDMSGLQVAKKIKNKNHKIIIVSMHSKIEYIIEAFQAGATGYMVKESARENLIAGLQTVCRGEYFLDSAVIAVLVQKLRGMPPKEMTIEDPAYSTLTPREQEILRYFAEGLKPREIAKNLYISPKTVDNHRSNIMHKLNLANTVELVRYAAKIGLVDMEK
ncbi:response regulator transcription factor [candidate division KSB1 bacterium]|nr:response regulator transcription factor [candidate division KSB1 bacterium]